MDAQRRFVYPMNLALLSHEWLIIALALTVLLADLWLPPLAKRYLGYLAAIGVRRC